MKKTRNRSLRCLYRSARIEPLESRQLLSVSPTLADIEDVTLYAGAPLYIALDGYDADGDALSYSISSTNSSITGSVLSGNRSMKIVVDGYGEMIFELFEDLAPETTAQIIALAESDFYDGLIFHRIAEYDDGTPFVIQGGDPLGTGSGGPGFTFDDEFNLDLLHTSSGILSMAKSNDDTNGSQFFITGTDTRHLDFNHSVFGFLTEGESVRQAIQAAEVDENDKPVDDIVMTSVEIFVDEENGTLMLKAPEGFTGEGDITVTVSDGNGGTTQRTFHVTVAADLYDSLPYLEEVDPVEVTAGASTTIQLSSYDAEGDAVAYDAIVYPTSDDITVSVNASGQLTVTATANAVGVYGIYVGVSSSSMSSWDTQQVPVYVSPQAPTSVELLSSSDTGTSDEDGVTNLDNELWFRVYGVVEDAEVSIYCDGTMIGQGMATEDGSLIVVSDSDIDLTEGTHQITAKQVLRDEVVSIGNFSDTVDIYSNMSAALGITIDLTAPVITSTPSNLAGVGVLYEYQVVLQTSESSVKYQLLSSPTGMTIDSNTGLIQWTPTTSAGDMQNVALKATDSAGNVVSQSFTLYIKQPPLFSAIENQTVAEGSLLQFTVEASSQNGNPAVVYSLSVNAPAGATIDATTGVVTWTPTEAQGPGSHPLVIYAADSDGVKNNMTVWVTVSEVNVAPVLDPIADMVVNEGQKISFTLPVTDADLPANTLTYSFVGDVPASASLDPSTGKLTWTPNEYQGGQVFNLTVRVTDAAGASDETSFTVTVAEVDDAPVFSSQESVQLAYPGMIFSTKFHAADPDVPTRSVQYSFVGDVPEGMTLDATTGQVTWNVPESVQFFQYSVTVRASEVLGGGLLGLSSTQTITVLLGSWLAALEQAMRGESESRTSSPLDGVDEAVLAAALAGMPQAPSAFSAGNLSSAKGSLSSGESGFVSEQGFFGLQLGTSTAGGGMVLEPIRPELDKERMGKNPPVRDEKVVPAGATENLPSGENRSDRGDQDDNLRNRTTENQNRNEDASQTASRLPAPAPEAPASESVAAQVPDAKREDVPRV